MYESFFGLKEKPFNNTPDPRFLYFSKQHKEALAQLIYGIKERKGFVVLSGEVGTGKTTILRALLKQLDPKSRVAYVFSTQLSATEFLKYVCHDFGLHVNGDLKVDYMTQLLDFLVKSHFEGKTTTLIVDEAQNLDISLFEEIRMLTNYETVSQKLLQVFLVGQPELNDHLERDELWQLKQRINTRYHLFPLNRQETKEYIQARMRIAGAKRLDHFTDGAIQKIYKHSRGIPRLINIICDNALLVGYALDTRAINEKIIQECVVDLDLEQVPKKYKIHKKTRGIYEKRPLLYAAFATILIGILAAGMVFLLLQNRSSSRRIETNQPFLQRNHTIENKDTNLARVEKIKEEKGVIQPLLQSKTELPDVFTAEKTPMMDPQGKAAGDLGKTATSQPLSAAESQAIRIAIVGVGDSISEIIFREFGRVDEDLLEEVRELNPEIEDLNWIHAGQKIRLPRALKESRRGPEGMSYFSQDIARQLEEMDSDL